MKQTLLAGVAVLSVLSASDAHAYMKCEGNIKISFPRILIFDKDAPHACSIPDCGESVLTLKNIYS
jgi:hypothetical protein